MKAFHRPMKISAQSRPTPTKLVWGIDEVQAHGPEAWRPRGRISERSQVPKRPTFSNGPYLSEHYYT